MSLLANTDAVELESAIPLDLYLRRTYRPDCDYIDGEVRERNAGYYPHSATMGIVGSMLHEFAKAIGTVALLSVRVRVSDDCVLVPDICLAHRTQPREDVIVTPPLLCVEVLAEEDTFMAMQDRVERYLAMGVENIWIVDQAGRYGWYATRQGFTRPEDGILRVEGTAIAISLAQIFAELDESSRRYCIATCVSRNFDICAQNYCGQSHQIPMRKTSLHTEDSEIATSE